MFTRFARLIRNLPFSRFKGDMERSPLRRAPHTCRLSFEYLEHRRLLASIQASISGSGEAKEIGGFDDVHDSFTVNGLGRYEANTHHGAVAELHAYAGRNEGDISYFGAVSLLEAHPELHNTFSDFDTNFNQASIDLSATADIESSKPLRVSCFARLLTTSNESNDQATANARVSFSTSTPYLTSRGNSQDSFSDQVDATGTQERWTSETFYMHSPASVRFDADAKARGVAEETSGGASIYDSDAYLHFEVNASEVQPDIRVLGFEPSYDSGTWNPELLQVNYKILDFPVPSFTIGFFASDDGFYDAGDRLLYEFQLTPSGPSKPEVTMGFGDSPANALLINTAHYLVIDPPEALSQALIDPEVGAVLVVADYNDATDDAEDDMDPYNEDNTQAFVGLHRHGEIGAVRGFLEGVESKVQIGAHSVLIAGRIDEYPTASIEELRVIMGDLDDFVQISKDTQIPVYVWARAGNDRVIAEADYAQSLYAWGGEGMDLLLGGRGDDFLYGEADRDVLFGDGFQGFPPPNPELLQSFVESLLQMKLMTGFDLVPAEGGNDHLYGGEGDELILGGLGNDTIYAGTGNTLILGDSFTASAAWSFDASNVFSKNGEVFNLLSSGFELQGKGEDRIYGSPDGVDIVLGGGGGDWIYASEEPVDLNEPLNILFGNDGDDYIKGGTGWNILVGGLGWDNITVADDADPEKNASLIFGDDFKINNKIDFNLESIFDGSLLFGFELELHGDGNDYIYGGPGFDFIVGGLGQDDIHGGRGDGTNIVFCDDFEIGPYGAVFDLLSQVTTIFASPSPIDWFHAAVGIIENVYKLFKNSEGFVEEHGDMYFGSEVYESVDIVFGGHGTDTLFGGAGNDFLVGGWADDIIDTGPGGTVMSILFDEIGCGGQGNDLIIGGNGNDLLFSDDGNDTFYGNGGDDTIFGGDGDDLLYGGEGNDRLYGEDGNDLLDGGPGDDMLVGGPGDDQLLGGPGDDTIWTGLGTDFVDGGEGVNSILSELLFVAAVTVNHGEAQRSNVESISLRFNQATNLEALIASGQISDAVQVAGIVLDNSRFRYDPSSYVLVIDLTIDGFGGSRATMLADGRYHVQLDTSLIRAEALAVISLLDDDGLADGFRRVAFHRLEGDFDGDRMVGTKDRDAFFTHYGSIDGQKRYDFAFDLNGDGVINIVDYFALIALWGHTL